jgi:diguanylate cyclase (GGDEF)-like protein
MTSTRPPLHIVHTPSATPSDARDRMADAEAADTLRAIGAGEVDAFVVSDGHDGQQVFTLSTADRPYRMFVENMRDGAVTLSATGLVLYANRRMAELLAVPAEAIVGAPLAAVLAGGLPLAFDALLGPDGHGATFEVELRDGAGATLPALAGTSPLEVDGDQLVCVTFADLSAQKAQDREIARLVRGQAKRLADLQDAQAALTRQATHDALTALPNRALLVDRIDQALAQTGRSGHGVAVLFVDLDRFKQINDTQGHAAGDALLVTVARTLVAALRPMDTVARIGGDEFVILIPDLESDLYAVELSSRLLHALGDRAADQTSITASVGISVSARGAATAEAMLNEADTAMYHAKSLGGGRYEVFDEALGRQVQERAAALQMLESALADERVIVHYQPIVDLAGGTIAGFEALVRITALDGSIGPPSAFVPAAEESGLVKPLGARVLAAACDEARTWPAPARGGRPLTVAVNLSSRQFEAGDLTTVVQTTLQRAGLSAARLHLELTETAIMELHPELLRQLAHLRDFGVEIGLDDFGTGYASLTHLRRLPLTFVKIDRSFVAGLGTDQEDDRIVAAVIDLAANLGLRSVAEGVETADQLQHLRDLGCDQAQGYHFARPMPATDVPAALRHTAW